jgi:hypothetical protein
MRHARIAIVVLFALLLSCGKVKELVRRFQKSKAPAATPSAAPAPVASLPPPVPAPPASASAGFYSTEAIHAIADDCIKASVLLSTAPHAKNDKYPWSFAKQALLAHPQFKIGSTVPPKSASTITLQQHDVRLGKTGKMSKALVAWCNNGTTCNKLAAMYKNVVRTSRPDVFCGKLPDTIQESGSIVDFGVDPAKDLPGRKDVVSQCARLAACTIAAVHDTPGDPGVECQKKPSDFKTQCGLQPTCAAVLECAKK